MALSDTDPSAPVAPPDGPPRGKKPPKASPPWGSALVALLVLAALFAWEAAAWKGAALPSVDYSQLYAWVDQGKVAKVTIEGSVVSGDLKGPETVEGHPVTTFRAVLPPQEDKDFLPLLRTKA